MFSHGLLTEWARTVQRERLEEARMAGLVKAARAGKPRLRDRWLYGGGAALIFVGRKLIERYGPKIPPPPTRKRPLAEGVPCDC